MYKVLIAGAGTIGRLIALLLAESENYHVYLVDVNQENLALVPKKLQLETFELDVTDQESLESFISRHKIEAVVSSLPYFYNLRIARAAAKLGLHYFDLTEDVEVASEVHELSKNQSTAFVSQCGVAPGFINIVANDLMQSFEELEEANLRAGCLPKTSNHPLKYAITWSLDGLINEYGNSCYGLVNGRKSLLQPLEDLESIELDGILYEAFNTSGGIGSLVDTYENKIKTLNYKTIRYPGHCEKMRFLMRDLHLNEDRDVLKKILLKSLPKTEQDVMLIYVSVSGRKNGEYVQETYLNKIYPQVRMNQTWTGIQVSTASSTCAVVDIVMNNQSKFKGYILQEDFSLKDFQHNRYGKIFFENYMEIR